MPLTAKGEEIKSEMEKEYGSKKGEQVFYASANKGTIKGVDRALPPTSMSIPGPLPPVRGPTPVSGYAGIAAGQPEPVQRDSAGFRLPETVSHADILAGSFKYGNVR